jgi:chemotaxis protein CheZ
MQVRQKVFRIEKQRMEAGGASCASGPEMGGSRSEIMAELKAIRSLIKPVEELSEQTISTFRHELAAAGSLKEEMQAIQAAISQTKQEIATLHHTGFQGQHMERVTNELDAIVMGTEGATEQILGAAEMIDSHASHLHTRLQDEHDKEVAVEMQEQVVRIFEACNFQDLTGQRINKVVTTLKFIEERVMKMVDIWGGLESFSHVVPEGMPKAEGHAALLNGPALAHDTDRINQDDIDALFD